MLTKFLDRRTKPRTIHPRKEKTKNKLKEKNGAISFFILHFYLKQFFLCLGR